MKKNQRFNPEIVRQLIILHQGISETNNLDTEISKMVINNQSKEKEALKEKYEIFFNMYRSVGEQISGHLTFANSFSAIFEADIDALAIEKKLFDEKAKVYPIGKKYSKLRIYYQAIDNRFSKGRRSSGWEYPNFGMSLICALTFNSRIFKFEIAKTEKGCDKVWTCEFIPEKAMIINKSRSYLSAQSQELKFCSSEKFTEVLNICKTITERVNIDLEKMGLEKFIPNIEVSEK